MGLIQMDTIETRSYTSSEEIMINKSSVAKVFLGGLFTMIITFCTAFVSVGTEILSKGGDIPDMNTMTWAVMIAGALITGFTQWKGYTSQPPSK